MNPDYLHAYPGFAAPFGAVGDAALLKVALRPELLKTWLALYQRNVFGALSFCMEKPGRTFG